MQKTTNSFIKGIDRDTNVNKYSNLNYYDAQNMRLITKDTLSNGALTNVNGVVPKLQFGAGDVIVGNCSIRNTLIFFAYNSTGGCIYTYSNSGTDALEYPTLIYSHASLVFNPNVKLKCIGNYETADIQKVYFTDGTSFFKHVNIIEDLTGKHPDSMDLVADITFYPIETEIESGGNLKAGKIEYAYQLYNPNGSESMISPASNIIHLTESGEGVNISTEYKGSEVGTIVNKSVIVSVYNHLGSTFTRGRLYAIEYTVYNQLPKVRIVEEFKINFGYNAVRDTGQSIGEITIEELRFIQNNFYPSTLETKNNYLIAGNIKEEYFEIDDANFDARAYRCKSDGSCAVFAGDTLVSINTSTWELDAEHEAYNKYNDWTNSYVGNLEIANVTSYDYKYQTDGLTEGGSGKNISYKFTTTEVLIDSSGTDNGWEYGLPRMLMGVTTPFENYCNPNTPIGYKRDEVYRFGIVFFDKKGRQSFVQWIGDIRMPDNKAFPYLTYKPGEPNNTYANILGIEFTLDLPTTVEDIISGYQIVRADRTNSDKTILSQGVFAYMVDGGHKAANEDANHIYSLATVPYVGDCVTSSSVVDRTTSVIGTVSHAKNYVKTGNTTFSADYAEFFSPEVVFNKPQFSISDAFIEIEGYLDTKTTTAIAGPISETSTITVADKYRKFTGYPDYKRRQAITTYKTYSPKLKGNSSNNETLNACNYVLGTKTFNNQCTTNTTTDTRWGLRGTFGLMELNYTLPKFNLNVASTNWTGLSGGVYPARIFTANYKVNIGRGAYGGSSYEARTNTRYYPVSEFIVNDALPINVYGGDTYINYMFYLRSMWDKERETSDGASNDIIESVVMVPFESSINVDLRLDQPYNYMQWGYYRGDGYNPNYKLMETTQMGVANFSTNYPIDLGNLYRYNTAYSCISKGKEYISKPFDYVVNRTIDTRVAASEKKFNGEYTDSWLKFKFNNVIDLENSYGAVERLLTFGNILYAFQHEAIASLSVNDRSLIQDNNVGGLVLGTGGILTRYDYVVAASGITTHDAVCTSDNTIYYVDSTRKRIYKLTNNEQPISVIKGIDSLLNTFLFASVLVGYDRGYNELLFTIDSATLVYNEFIDAFVSRYTFVPQDYITHRNDLLTVSLTNEESILMCNSLDNVLFSDSETDTVLISESSESPLIYKHNVGNKGEFYSEGGLLVSDSYVELIINPNGNIVNSYDNIDFRTDVITQAGADVPTETIYKIDFSNDYQSYSRNLTFTMGVTNPSTDNKYNSGTVKRIARVWRAPLVPIVQLDTKRMIDTYLKLKLWYNNSTDNHFRFHDLITYFRPSNQ